LRQRAADSVRHLDWMEISGDLDHLLQETIRTHERQHRVIPTFCFAPD
jgi:flavin-binding protein dodecin